MLDGDNRACNARPSTKEHTKINPQTPRLMFAFRMLNIAAATANIQAALAKALIPAQEIRTAAASKYFVMSYCPPPNAIFVNEAKIDRNKIKLSIP